MALPRNWVSMSTTLSRIFVEGYRTGIHCRTHSNLLTLRSRELPEHLTWAHTYCYLCGSHCCERIYLRLQTENSTYLVENGSVHRLHSVVTGWFGLLNRSASTLRFDTLPPLVFVCNTLLTHCLSLSLHASLSTCLGMSALLDRLPSFPKR